MQRQGHRVDVLRTVRPAVLGLGKALALGYATLASAAPVSMLQLRDLHNDEAEAEGAALWVLFSISMVLVLLGGAFAGLTIALMGQDSVYLQVLSQDPEEPQRKNAKRVADLLGRGKHWVLVTLLLSNVIVNETLPVVLDRCFGGGVAAVVGSTVLIGMSTAPPPACPPGGISPEFGIRFLRRLLRRGTCGMLTSGQLSLARSSLSPSVSAMVSRLVASCRSLFSFSCISVSIAPAQLLGVGC